MSAGYRVCCCVGYLTNPGGRCCMDMTFETDTGRKITSPHTVPELPMISGWVCGKCGASNAPWVLPVPVCDMKVIVVLGLENDQEGNTWWSNGHPDSNSIQLHVDRAVYVALGSPDKITVTVEKA